MKSVRVKKIKQRDASDCGPACIVSVAGRYGARLSVSRVRQIAGTDIRGTSAYGIIGALEVFGFRAKGIRCTSESLDQLPLPAIMHLSKGGTDHYVVLAGLGKRGIRVMNPAVGKFETYTRSAFLGLWSGIAIILSLQGDTVVSADAKGNRRRLLQLISPHRSILIQVFLGASAYTLMGFSTSIYIQKLTDLIIAYQLSYALHLAGIMLILIAFFQLILLVVKNQMVLRTGQMIDVRLILGYYRHLLTLPQRFFDSMKTGEIISRINDAARIRQFLSETITGVFLNLLIVVFSIGVMCFLHLKLALIISSLLPVYGMIYMIYNRLNRTQERKVMEGSAQFEAQLVESLQNMRTVKLLNLCHHMEQELEFRFIPFLRSLYRSGCNLIFSQSATDFSSRMITLIMLWVGAGMIFRQELTLGELMSFYAILGYMTGPAASLIGINRTLQNAKIAADRLFEVFDLEEEKDRDGMELEPLKRSGIRFNEVWFSYGTRGHLYKGLTFEIPSRSITAIIGESGSGKSTLAHLLTGLYQIESGRIEIDGYPLSAYSTGSLRKRISIVPQQTELFSGSLIGNIDPHAAGSDIKRIYGMADRLGLGELIRTLPRGLQTEIGENGLSLSGGERQRISMIRALYREPVILVLDEPMSALDESSALRVIELIREERLKGTTILVITHHPEQIEANYVLELHNGQIAGLRSA